MHADHKLEPSRALQNTCKIKAFLDFKGKSLKIHKQQGTTREKNYKHGKNWCYR